MTGQAIWKLRELGREKRLVNVALWKILLSLWCLPPIQSSLAALLDLITCKEELTNG